MEHCLIHLVQCLPYILLAGSRLSDGRKNSLDIHILPQGRIYFFTDHIQLAGQQQLHRHQQNEHAAADHQLEKAPAFRSAHRSGFLLSAAPPAVWCTPSGRHTFPHCLCHSRPSLYRFSLEAYAGMRKKYAGMRKKYAP